MLICAGKDTSYYVRCLVLLYPVLVISVVLGKSCHHAHLSAKPIWTYVQSPGYPASFPAQTQCWWRITAPPQFRVYLQFTTFDLVSPDNNKHCVWQWLNVVEGSEDLQTIPDKITLCGKTAPKVIVSQGNVLRLNLHSNSAVASETYKGFRARYKYTTELAHSPPSEMSMADYNDEANNNPVDNPNQNPENGNVRSLGSVLAPIIKTKPLPPNPNAVLTLRNRRIELQNQLRNSGIGASNADTNTVPPWRKQAFGPKVPVRPVTDGNTIPQNIHPPGSRRKPLPNEIKILLAVMGTIALIAILLFIAKKLFCDRRCKDKSDEGRIMHAYANFRHFNKKRKKGDTLSPQVNTLSRNVQEGSSTIQSSDSGLSTSHNTPKQIKKKTVQSDNSSSNESKRVKLQNVVPKVRPCGSSNWQKTAQQSTHDPEPRTRISPTRQNTRERNPTANQTLPVPRSSTECSDGRRKMKHHHRVEMQANKANNVQQEHETNRCRRKNGERRKHGTKMDSSRPIKTTSGDQVAEGHRRRNWREQTYR